MPRRAESQTIRFGTGGWRGILAQDFTFERLARALHGAARFFAASGGGEVVVAHDTRLLGERMAELAARVLAAHGLEPIVARGAVATPVATRAVQRRGAAGAVVLTASHNPPEYQGLKVFGRSGAALDGREARRVEGWIGRAPARVREAARRFPQRDLRAAYLRDLARLLDRRALARARLEVAYDAMHGAGAGTLDAALEQAGVRVLRLRAQPDPGFGGAAPDPTPERLAALRRAVRALPLGVATDGDADRFSAVLEGGHVLSATDALALLVDHLARTGRARRGLALSQAVGSFAERVAAAHGLPVLRCPPGFAQLSRALREGRADLAGDESGGFAFAGFGLDKDGMLAALLCAEAAAAERTPLRARLAALRRRVGGGVCGRAALPAGAGLHAAFGRLRRSPPERVGGCAVRAASHADGLRLAFDDGFLLLRLSATEPVLRVYAEAAGPRGLRRRLAAGMALLRPRGVSPGSR
jgi:phosphomannomutase